MLSLEELEPRNVPAITTSQIADLLFVNGETDQPNVIVVESKENQIKIIANNTTLQFPGINYVYITGGNKNDVIQNNTNLRSSIYGLDGNDIILGGATNDFLVGGNGQDIIYDMSGNNRIYTYDNEPDFTIASPPSFKLTDSKDKSTNQPVFYFNNTIFLTANNNGNRFTVVTYAPESTPPTTIVTYDLNDNTGQHILGIDDPLKVKQIVFFGGNGNDIFMNYTSINDFALGANGNDTFIGGNGAINFLEGNSGDDLLIARAVNAKLFGNSGNNIFLSSVSKTLFYTDSAAFDYIFTLDDEDTVVKT